jgi:ABC-type amino acid transport substrate-binding protein
VVRPVDSYTPPLDLQWNVAVGLRNADDALVSAVNQAIDRLLADGVIQGIFAKYGIAYVAPRAF